MWEIILFENKRLVQCLVFNLKFLLEDYKFKRHCFKLSTGWLLSNIKLYCGESCTQSQKETSNTKVKPEIMSSEGNAS